MTALHREQLPARLTAAGVHEHFHDLLIYRATRDGSYTMPGRYMLRYHKTADCYTLAVYA